MNDKRQHPRRGKDETVEEPTDGNMGPTGSGGVASQSPSPGHKPVEDHSEDPGADTEDE